VERRGGNSGTDHTKVGGRVAQAVSGGGRGFLFEMESLVPGWENEPFPVRSKNRDLKSKSCDEVLRGVKDRRNQGVP